MRKTIKKILKEQTEGGFNRFELVILNWLFEKLDGKPISNQVKHYQRDSYSDYLLSTHLFMSITKYMKEHFGLNNKMAAEIISLYRENYTENGFNEVNNVIRKPVKKWEVKYSREVYAYKDSLYNVYGETEDDAYMFADASDSYGGDFAESSEVSGVDIGDIGEIIDTEIYPISESIKKELNILKESINDKLNDKFLLQVCKSIEEWFISEGMEFMDLESGWDGAELYGHLIDFIDKTYSLPEHTIHYLIAVYGENCYRRINGNHFVWDSFETASELIKPKPSNWEGHREYGASSWVVEKTLSDAYNMAQLNYQDTEGFIDWDDYSFDINDTWDHDTNWVKK